MTHLIEPIHVDTPAGEAVIAGECDPAFSALRDAFVGNVARLGEIGSGVCLYRDGRKAVDLWGGWLDAGRSRAWERESLCSVYSISKSLCALSVHILVERGRIDLETPVANYWPEFAQSGKDKITVRQVLSHNCGVLFNDRARLVGPLEWSNWNVSALMVAGRAWPA